MLSDSSSIAAGVILYYPDKDVIENIRGYLPFVNKVFIADNSDEPVVWVRDAFLDNPKIVFTAGTGNRGIAAALNECCDTAVKENYLWLLTMDQDSTVSDAQFFNEFHNIIDKKKVGIFAASFSLPAKPDKGFFVEATEVIASGNLLNLKAWGDIAGFCEKLFIDEVDHDFCARLTLKNYKIFTTGEIYLEHHLGSKFKVYHKGRKEEITLIKHVPIRMYYITRNTLFLLKTYFFSNRELAVTRFREWLIKLYQIYRFYPDRNLYYPFIRKGIFDFIRGKYGKHN